VADRLGTAIIFPLFALCRAWCGQIVCGVTVVSALTRSPDPWYLVGVAWELERPVPCGQGVRVKGNLGMWLVSAELRTKFEGASVGMKLEN